MPISRVNFQSVSIPPATDSGGGGGGGNTGEWTYLEASDLQTEVQSHSSINLSSSPISGFDHRVEVATINTQTFSAFVRNNVACLYFDTGFSVDDLSDGDGQSAVLQIAWDVNGVEQGSSYEQNTGYPTGVCLFSSLKPPPFASASPNPRGGFYGHGFLHYFSNTDNHLVMGPVIARRTRDNTSAGLLGGTLYNYQSGIPFSGLVHTLTASQGRTGAGNKALCLTQGDFNAFEEYTADNIVGAISTVGQQQDQTNGFTISSSDTVKLGVMFNVFIDASKGGTSPSPAITWDFNLKWRKLVAGA